MNNVGRRTTAPATGWADLVPLKKFAPLGVNLFKHYTGIAPLSKVPTHLTATHLEKEVDSHTGKNSVKVPLTTTEKLGLAAGELLVGGARFIPCAALVVAPACNTTGMNNSICQKASTINDWELWFLKQGWGILKEGVNNIVPLAKSGFEVARVGMTEEHTYIVTHLGLLGSGLYLLNSAMKDYKTSPLSVSRFGKITLTRQSNTLGANATKVAKFLGKGALGVVLVGTSLAFSARLIDRANIPSPTNGTNTTKI